MLFLHKTLQTYELKKNLTKKSNYANYKYFYVYLQPKKKDGQKL